MQSKVQPTYKTKYRVANWPTYNQALVRRGDVTLWLSSEAIAAWTPPLNTRACSASLMRRWVGGLKGYWSIAISGNWRVIFRFENGDAYDVDLIDYH